MRLEYGTKGEIMKAKERQMFGLDASDKKKLKTIKGAKEIEVAEYSFDSTKRPWYKRKEVLTKREFEARRKKYRAKEFEETSGTESDWKKGRLNEFYD